ncbi:MAG: NTP transferase domain-containing protein, partial [Coriobacteriia bacterium]|nr:NTP transferase domain-containing protein [Coriobacteriia bacterium]
MTEAGAPPNPPEAGPVPHLHAVVLAGGSGTRFWPLSRDLNPKQMLSIWGGESLIAQTVERALPLVGPGAVHLLAGERLRDELRGHIGTRPAMRAAAIEYLSEPMARNTAPAIALAAAYLERLDPDAVMLVLPSDHIMESGTRWEAVVRSAARAAEEGWLVTVGLVPGAAETGYGYIKTGGPLPEAEGAGAEAPPAGSPAAGPRPL